MRWLASFSTWFDLEDQENTLLGASIEGILRMIQWKKKDLHWMWPVSFPRLGSWTEEKTQTLASTSIPTSLLPGCRHMWPVTTFPSLCWSEHSNCELKSMLPPSSWYSVTATRVTDVVSLQRCSQVLYELSRVGEALTGSSQKQVQGEGIAGTYKTHGSKERAPV